MRKLNYKQIALLVGELFLFALTLALYIKSYSFYQDEWGTDISFNSDYLVVMLIAITMIVHTSYTLLNKGNKEQRYLVAGTLSTALASFYPLGVFFKALFKAMNKGKVFEYASYQGYLYIGIFALCLFVYFLIGYIESKKETKSK